MSQHSSDMIGKPVVSDVIVGDYAIAEFRSCSYQELQLALGPDHCSKNYRLSMIPK